MRYLLMAVFLWLPLSFAYANQPTLLRVNQARNNDLDITAYLEVRDEHGAFVTSIDPKSLNVKFGDKATELKSIKPFDSAKDGIAYIFLVDISKSTKSNGIFNEMKAALMEWANTLGDNDRTALLTFGDNVNTIVDFTNNPDTFKAGVASVVPSDQHTELNKGIITAVHIGQRIDSTLPSRRVIIVLSDGINDRLGGPEHQDVIDVLKVDPVPIYVVGLDKGLDKLPKNSERVIGLEAMNKYASRSGGDYLSASNNSIMGIYKNLRGKLSEVFVVKLFCPGCSPKESEQRLQFNFNINTATLTSAIDMRLTARAGVEEIRHDIKQVSQKTDKLSVLIDSISKTVSDIGIMLAVSVFFGLGLVVSISFFIRNAINKKKVIVLGGGTITSESTAGIPETEKSPVIGTIYPTPHYWLSLTSLLGSRQSSVYDVRFTNDAIIGSGDGCDTVIPNDLEIAPQHCAFSFDGNHVTLYDLGMGNGTLVNGVKITQRYRLEEGDIITLGRTQLRVNLHGIQG